MFLLLEGVADGKVPLDGDGGEGHDLDGARHVVAEGLQGAQVQLGPRLGE